MNDQDLYELHSAASAIAAFQLSQFCFSALVQNGIVPKPDAERLLRQAVQTNKNGWAATFAASSSLAGDEERKLARLRANYPPAPGKKQRTCVVPSVSKYGHTTAGPKRFGSVTTVSSGTGTHSP